MFTSTARNQLLKYRSYKSEDIPGILELWEKHSDFGSISEKNFTDWYIDCPYEKCEIIVAENTEGTIMAQMVFMPTRMTIHNSIVKALKVSAPILHNEIKLSITDFFHNPIWKMYSEGMMFARKNNFEVLYFFPQRGWLRAIEMVRPFINKVAFATYNAFSVTLTPEEDYSLPAEHNLYFQMTDSFDKEYDTLWTEGVKNIPVKCGIIRSAEWLAYRLKPHCTVEARMKHTNRLIGYCSINKSKGTLLDLFAVSQDFLQPVFHGTVNYLCRNDPKKHIFDGQITGMYTPLMKSVIKNMKIGYPKYEYAFGCIITGKQLTMKEVGPDKWYMMPDVN